MFELLPIYIGVPRGRGNGFSPPPAPPFGTFSSGFQYSPPPSISPRPFWVSLYAPVKMCIHYISTYRVFQKNRFYPIHCNTSLANYRWERWGKFQRSKSKHKSPIGWKLSEDKWQIDVGDGKPQFFCNTLYNMYFWLQHKKKYWNKMWYKYWYENYKCDLRK